MLYLVRTSSLCLDPRRICFGEIAPHISKLSRVQDDLSSILDMLVSRSASRTCLLKSLSLSHLPLTKRSVDKRCDNEVTCQEEHMG